MSQSTRDDLNKVISFNLKEDGGVPISNLSKESLSIIDQYLDKEFSNNPKLDENIELKQVHGKITSALEWRMIFSFLKEKPNNSCKLLGFSIKFSGYSYLMLRTII